MINQDECYILVNATVALVASHLGRYQITLACVLALVVWCYRNWLSWEDEDDDRGEWEG